MSCNSCWWYKTVGEMFSSNFKSMWLDLECSKKLPTLNKAMAHLWSYAFALPWFRISEMIDVSQVTHETCERIFMPVGFYWKWCSWCIAEDAQCWSCADWYWKIDMTYKDSVPYIGHGQYTIKCPLSKTVEYLLPRWVSEWYFTYYRYFDTLIDENSEIKIPQYLEPALEMLLQYHASTTDPADKVAIWEDFINYIKQQYEVFKLSSQTPTNISFKLFA